MLKSILARAGCGVTGTAQQPQDAHVGTLRGEQALAAERLWDTGTRHVHCQTSSGAAPGKT